MQHFRYQYWFAPWVTAAVTEVAWVSFPSQYDSTCSQPAKDVMWSTTPTPTKGNLMPSSWPESTIPCISMLTERMKWDYLYFLIVFQSTSFLLHCMTTCWVRSPLACSCWKEKNGWCLTWRLLPTALWITALSLPPISHLDTRHPLDVRPPLTRLDISAPSYTVPNGLAQSVTGVTELWQPDYCQSSLSAGNLNSFVLKSALWCYSQCRVAILMFPVHV